jgi:hypothetical protein
MTAYRARMGSGAANSVIISTLGQLDPCARQLRQFCRRTEADLLR